MVDVPPIFPTDDPKAHEQLRELLHSVSDQIADYLAELGDKRIFPEEVVAPQGSLFPTKGEPLDTAFQEVFSWADANSIHVGAPGYVGHMDSGVAVAGIVADFLASALNQNLLAFELAPGATLLEKKLVRLFADLAGFGPTSDGVFTTGGTTANLTALLIARDSFLQSSSQEGINSPDKLCVFASQEAHYSIAKSCAVIGIGSNQVIPIPTTGPQRRLDPSALSDRYQEARLSGMQPFALVATAGTTSCGAIDPIRECADFCTEHGLWLHVDAAHGGALLLHSTEKAKLSGIERADSASLDPHKWLYTPKSAGILLLQHGQHLQTADYEAPYLDRFSSHGDALPLSQGRRALDGSRRFDALKVWLMLKHFGQNGIEGLIESRLELTQWLYQRLAQSDFFKPSHLPDLNVLAFQPRQATSPEKMAEVHKMVESEGSTWPSYTTLDGQACHRMVLINPSTTQAHLEQCLQLIKLAHRGGFQHSERARGVLHSYPDSP